MFTKETLLANAINYILDCLAGILYPDRGLEKKTGDQTWHI